MAWAGVQVARRQVALAPPEISSLLPRPLLMEEISPHWGTCRPLPLSHLLSPPVLVPISSPIQVRRKRRNGLVYTEHAVLIQLFNSENV